LNVNLNATLDVVLDGLPPSGRVHVRDNGSVHVQVQVDVNVNVAGSDSRAVI